MSERCTECGAVLPEGSTCQTIFDEFLILEYTNPVYGQVHFLTVACFIWCQRLQIAENGCKV